MYKTVMSSSSSVQFSYNDVNAGRSIILLNIKINVPINVKPLRYNFESFLKL